MSRRPRVVIPGVPLHIIQRGNNRQACFGSEKDYRRYLEWLGEYSQKECCQIHAYALMTNHVHLLVSSEETSGFGNLMKRLGQRYVQYFNRTHGRSGTLWEGRFRSSLLEAEPYLLICQRYIELNPVRAGMVKHPVDYPWSSYHANANNQSSDMVHPHDVYQKLGKTMKERSAVYKELCEMEIKPDIMDRIRTATNANYVLGNNHFTKNVEKQLGRRVTFGKSGRPIKKA